MKMFTRKWLQELRSGKYNQTRGSLRTHDDIVRHCCLGVGCQVLGVKRVRNSFHDSSATNTWNGEELPTPRQLKRMGLTRRQASKLAELNDSYQSFDVIAAHIERYYAK